MLTRSSPTSTLDRAGMRKSSTGIFKKSGSGLTFLESVLQEMFFGEHSLEGVFRINDRDEGEAQKLEAS